MVLNPNKNLKLYYSIKEVIRKIDKLGQQMSQPQMSINDINETSRAMQELSTKLQTLSEQKAQAIIQQRECELVLEEFKYLDETDVIMKQSGPTLMNQDINEAKENIEGRIKFIENQIKQIEQSIKTTDDELKKKEDILRKVGAQPQN